MTMSQAIGVAGISYRQADYWRSQGFVVATADGSGTVSVITTDEALIMARIAQLVRIGMAPRSAAPIARATVERRVRAVDVPGDIRIVFDVAAKRAGAS